ncbi:diguanylate cyclase [Bacillus luteolus]|uniref:Diguanylate cyclase n=1 Tax=Litchfieldia luteola TaxID=682179 RepID=A0ABR9QJK2_9BACI|nr:diguanylate cyclase [Cytobacillus luteolus]MBE4908354.1 diguanylate cyclase [Cytobacillus luteolus]MBP1943142.1 diguanylate cyclase [Cytobacillus luteolus]
MLSDLVINISILMSFTFIWHQLFRHNRLTMNSPLKIKLLDGLIAGLLGIILMHYSIQVNEITILDLRHIPVVLVAFFGGFIPTLVSVIVISIGRFLIAYNFSSVVSLFMMFTIAFGASFISLRLRLTPWVKWLTLLVYSQTIFSLALYIVVDNFNEVLDFALYHVISTMVGGTLIYHFVNYIRLNSELYLKYKESSQRDSLTGLFNVRSFDYYYNSILTKTMEMKGDCSICIIDVDHFKQINDTYGHLAGDQVLKQLANLLKSLTREGDVLSRNGGEEFSIILPHCNHEKAKEIAERIRRKVEEEPFYLSGNKQINLTVSVGIAAYYHELEKPYTLFQEADDALYHAKRNGRNIVCSSSRSIRDTHSVILNN